jgi:ribosomal protein L11 methyltransferase
MPVRRLDVLVEKGVEESLDAEFYSMCNGLWIEDHDGQVLIKCYPSETDTFVSYLRRSMPAAVVVAVAEEADTDYVSMVRRHFVPVRIGDVTILPPWRKTRKKGKIIVIEPGMAFGTGRHESTKMMIRLMGRVDVQGKSVLDIGSGSGILAIYARLMGAGSVVAIDHDPLAAEAIRKGCELNYCDDVTYACSGMEGVKGHFQVVLANLDFDTFKLHASRIIDLVESGGCLVISGIERQYETRVRPLFQALTLIRRARMRDWRSFVFRKR